MGTPWLPGYQPPDAPKAASQVQVRTGEPFRINLFAVGVNQPVPRVEFYILQKYGLKEEVIFQDNMGGKIFIEDKGDDRMVYFREDGSTKFTPGSYEVQVYVDNAFSQRWELVVFNHPDADWPSSPELDGSVT